MKIQFIEPESRDDYRRIEAWIGDVTNRKVCSFCPHAFGSALSVDHGPAELIGYIRWVAVSRSPAAILRRGMIGFVFVDEAYRHQGVATALWYAARSTDNPPRHSGNLTRDGKAWVAALRHRRRRIRLPDVEAHKHDDKVRQDFLAHRLHCRESECGPVLIVRAFPRK